MTVKAIVIHLTDNVATMLVPAQAGHNIVARCGHEDMVVEALQFVDVGHKIALRDIDLGAPVIKYGQRIGVSSRPIKRGEHVHIHNLQSERGRGDLVRGPSF